MALERNVTKKNKAICKCISFGQVLMYSETYVRDVKCQFVV